MNTWPAKGTAYALRNRRLSLRTKVADSGLVEGKAYMIGEIIIVNSIERKDMRRLPF